MSKGKKPHDEHRESCNRVLRVLAELPLDVLEKIVWNLGLSTQKKLFPIFSRLGFRSDS